MSIQPSGLSTGSFFPSQGYHYTEALCPLFILLQEILECFLVFLLSVTRLICAAVTTMTLEAAARFGAVPEALRSSALPSQPPPLPGSSDLQEEPASFVPAGATVVLIFPEASLTHFYHILLS